MNIHILNNDTINETIYKTVLNSGLKVFYLPKKNYSKKYAIFATNYGSNDNEFLPKEKNDFVKMPEGIAHFLEHKLFEEPEGNIFNEFSKLGSYVNAYTNFTITAYLFSCSENFEKNLELLIKFVQNPYFTDENIEKEKGIIEQEIRMYDDNPNWKVFVNLLRNMYINHPIKNDIAGTIDSIRRINKDMLYECYNTFYNSNNMILFMVGDIDFDNTIKMLENIIKIDNFKYEKEIKRKDIIEPESVNNYKIEENMSITVPLVNIGFKDTILNLSSEKFLKKQLCTDILLEILFGVSSDFYLENYEDGIINSTFGAQYIGNKNYGHSIIGGESNSPNILETNIKKYIIKVRETGININDFNRIKKKLIGNFIINMNSLEYIANNFISYHFLGTSLLDYLNILKKIRIDDVIERFNNHIKEDNMVISVIKPNE